MLWSSTLFLTTGAPPPSPNEARPYPLPAPSPLTHHGDVVDQPTRPSHVRPDATLSLPASPSLTGLCSPLIFKMDPLAVYVAWMPPHGRSSRCTPCPAFCFGGDVRGHIPRSVSASPRHPTNTMSRGLNSQAAPSGSIERVTDALHLQPGHPVHRTSFQRCVAKSSALSPRVTSTMRILARPSEMTPSPSQEMLPSQFHRSSYPARPAGSSPHYGPPQPLYGHSLPLPRTSSRPSPVTWLPHGWFLSPTPWPRPPSRRPDLQNRTAPLGAHSHWVPAHQADGRRAQALTLPL